MDHSKLSHNPSPSSARNLVERLLGGESEAVLKAALKLRREGWRGALHYALLACLAPRTPAGLQRARALAASATDADRYFAFEIFESESWLYAASWVLHHELGQTIAPGTSDPAVTLERRIELEQALQEGRVPRELGRAVPPSERQAWQAFAAARSGELEESFRLLYRLSAAPDLGGQTYLRAAQALFQAVPRRRRVEIFVYGALGEIRNLGIAPIESAGFVVKEYTGITAFHAPLLAKRPVRLAPVRLIEWQAGWNPRQGVPELAVRQALDARSVRQADRCA